jgi:hypothetical protein
MSPTSINSGPGDTRFQTEDLEGEVIEPVLVWEVSST